MAELHPNTVGQHLVVEFAQRGWLEELINRARNSYKARCLAMDTALQRRRLPGARWAIPAGGMFLWLQLPEEVDVQNLLAETVKQGVAFLPGSLMYPAGGPRNVCRLNFSVPDEAAIEQGIATIVSTARQLLRQPAQAREGQVVSGPIV